MTAVCSLHIGGVPSGDLGNSFYCWVPWRGPQFGSTLPCVKEATNRAGCFIFCDFFFFLNQKLERQFQPVEMFFSCLLSRIWLFATPWTAATPVFLVLHYLPEFAQTHVHWVSDAIQPSHSLSPLLWPSIFPSIRVFSSELALRIRWPKYWSFSTNFPKTLSPFCNYLSLSGALSSLNVILKFSVSGCISVCCLQASKALSRNSEGSSFGFYFPFVFYRVSLFGVPVS